MDVGSWTIIILGIICIFLAADLIIIEVKKRKLEPKLRNLIRRRTLLRNDLETVDRLVSWIEYHGIEKISDPEAQTLVKRALDTGQALAREDPDLVNEEWMKRLEHDLEFDG